MGQTLHIMGLRLRRSWMPMLGISIISTIVGMLWWQYDVLGISGDEYGAYDDGMQTFTNRAWFPWGKNGRADDIVIVAIDDKTFIDVKTFGPWRMRYGAWPYDRVIYADVFEYLQEAGAKMIVFDATLDEPKPDPTGDMALGETVVEKGIPLYLGFNVIPKTDPLPQVEAVNHPPIVPAPPPKEPEPAQAKPPGEETFPAEEEFPDDSAAKGGEEFPAEGSDEFPSEDAPAKEDPARKAERLKKVAGLYAFPVEVRGGLELPLLPGVPTYDERGEPTGEELPQFPVPAIDPALDAASGWGLVLLEEDDDGKMRRTRFAYTDGTNTYVTLPVAAAADALKADKLIIEPGLLTLGSKQIPIDQDGAAWIEYPGELSSRYKSISLVDVLRARKVPEMAALFKDKYVFVAGFALGTSDVKATPLETQTPGVAKQLAVFEGLMHRGFITTSPMWVSLIFTFLMCLFSAALVLVIRNVFVDIGWPVLLYAGFFMLTGSLLVMTKVHFLTALPSFAGTIASILTTVYERLFGSQDRERLKTQFAAYMEEHLVEAMVEGRSLPKLDGEAMRVTAFISDIKSFAAFNERYREDPRGLMRLLNRYLSTVTPVLTGQGACIDKYIGDSVVALFGAPVRHRDHALRACIAALELEEALTELRAELKSQGLPDLQTRVGINTDTMMVGNMGSEQLLDYTAIGDGMNLAARLQAANRSYGTLVLVGENTALDVQRQLVLREVDLIRLPGRRSPTRVFELVGRSGKVDGRILELLDFYAKALELYRGRDFHGASALVQRALSVDPNDGPSRTLKARCEKLQVTAPPADWDGVTVMEK